MSDLDPFSTAEEVAAAIRSRQVSPREVVDLYLERIDTLDPLLNAFDHRDDERVRRWADAATDTVLRLPPEDLPPFHGVPLPIKSLNQVAGWPTSYGSRASHRRPQPADDVYVARLRAAGFLPLGMTTTPEFGSVAVTESRASGATRNPWDRSRTPGGSSGGSAVAVSAGLAPVALGSDGGGSIRGPASCTGLVGHKASRGRVPGLVNAMEGVATEGALARSVADVAAVLDVLAVHDAHGWYTVPAPERPFRDEVGRDPGALRIALSSRPLVDLPVAAACREALARAGRDLAALGHDVTEAELPIPDRDALVEDFLLLWRNSATGIELADRALVEPLNAWLMRGAEELSSRAYLEATYRLQMQSRQAVAGFGADYDVVVTPTIPMEPPPIGWLFDGVDADPEIALRRALAMAAFTAQVNCLGLPAISVPVHVAASGLPVGVQLIGGPWDDAGVLRLAAQLEAASTWCTRPPLHERATA